MLLHLVAVLLFVLGFESERLADCNSRHFPRCLTPSLRQSSEACGSAVLFGHKVAHIDIGDLSNQAECS